MTVRRRALGEEIVRRGFAVADEVAALLGANRVRVNGAVVTNPGSLVAPDDDIVVIAAPSTYVSRGGTKLAGALNTFGINVVGRRCVDAGASTGGFTDCLLQRGAVHVVAIDTGRGQLHQRLVTDPRVTSWEATNVLDVTPERLGALEGYGTGAGMIVADLSFTSSARLAAHLAALAAGEADLVVLVKPQFEAPRSEVPRGGVVTDEGVQSRAVDAVRGALVGAGCEVLGVCESPITGSEGNREFFVWGRAHTGGSQ